MCGLTFCVLPDMCTWCEGTTAGEYALPAVQSSLRELRRGLAPPALCLEPHKTKVNGQVKGERINFCVASVKRWDMRIAVSTFVRNRVQRCPK